MNELWLRVLEQVNPSCRRATSDLVDQRGRCDVVISKGSTMSDIVILSGPRTAVVLLAAALREARRLIWPLTVSKAAERGGD
jgi:hypothetical protein